MKDYDNAFLGIILAGVLMLVVGLSLLIRPGPAADGTDRATTKRSVGSLVQNDPRVWNYFAIWRAPGRDILFES